MSWLDRDPLEWPWEGVAVHGDTPFSCMLISHIEGNLWVGGCIDGLKLADDFKYVVSLYPWERYRLGQDTRRVEYELYDDATPLSYLDDLLKIADQAFEFVQDGKTLIHCQAGLNRSGLIAGLVLVKQGLTGPQALELLRERRTEGVLCNPDFRAYLIAQ